MPPRATLDREDACLLAQLSAELQAAERALGTRLDYGRGCPACCLGPFPVNALDARRLRRGLARLERSEPRRAAALRRRARAAWAQLEAAFPGDARSGRLGPDEAAEEAFAARFAELPCPALDPRTRRCELYEWRPLSCRTFGPPVRVGRQALPGCELCVRPAATGRERRRAQVDPEGREARLLAHLEARGQAGETIVAAALALSPGRPRSAR